MGGKQASLREQYRNDGIFTAKKEECLHALGCSLYWAEGAKGPNCIMISNSAIYVLKTFIRFAKKYFDVSNQDFSYMIHSYTDLKTSEEIEQYWKTGLNLEGATRRKHNFLMGKYESKNNSDSLKGKSSYGTCYLYIKKSTRIIQHIYGAIEYYGGGKMDRYGKHSD